MDEKIIEISFNIIAHAGDAKGLAFEAIKEAKEGNIEAARECIKKSKEGMVVAHRFQTELIQNEASGNKTEMSVILVHAQDHLMNAMNFQQLAEEFIDLYERLEK
ncbi:PTS lactose/cellobiose transporter subunit IIA [Romboutsia lituseburensis]|uniref:PTS system, cellobiose-specific IIA component n=1 Tax=Romboutsia lituseburensis DSM 797 TaxID=1121325 RepID=A0A1G9STH5_9FIRM|nr:PTS lactose/cellobiose transporter subunit IIA [Romboutsia lituseburensis]CEH33020.1 PTS system, IIa component [Romboutsia lituseburensis]SDM38155.1 PTS system, cellobiose-specific IIA component [Romboutsia lituseburensis DSM 797]